MSTLRSVQPWMIPQTEVNQASALVRLLRLSFLLVSNILLLGFLLFWSFSDSAPPLPLQLSSVQWLQGGQDGDVPDDAAAGAPIQLPWKVARMDRSGAAGVGWLRLGFQLPAEERDLLAAYFSYLAPGARVYLNGSEIGQAHGPVTAIRNSWSVPVYFPLVSSLLHAGSNRIDIHFGAANGGIVDVGRVVIGPDSATRPIYKRRLRIQSMGVQIVCLLVGLMGAVNLMIWWRRRQEVIYGLSGLSSLFSILRNFEFFLDDPPIPVPVYLLICEASQFWLAALLIHICEIVLQSRHRWMTRAGYGLALVTTLFLMTTGIGSWMAVPDALLLLLESALAIVLTVRVWYSQQIAHGLLWCAVLITAAAGFHQFLLIQHQIHRPDINLMPYGWLLFSRAISWLLIDGFIKTHNEQESINLGLEQRIETFGRELEAQYSRIATLERCNAVTAERERIVRDMHDGLGFHLITALSQVSGRSLTQSELVEVFSNALTELRKPFHDSAPEPNDLFHALAGLRSRVEVGLRDTGIALCWSVEPQTASRDLAPSVVHEAICIVQEALANAIKHSRSAIVYLQVCSAADGVTQIRVIDQGIGFGGDAARSGEGMITMRWRAAKIGASLDILSSPGCTEVALVLPGSAGQNGLE